MFRTALIAILLVIPGTALASQTADEAYGACLIGHTVEGVIRSDMPMVEALDRAQGKCTDVAASADDPAAVEDDVIHFLDNQFYDAILAPKLTGFTLDGELGSDLQPGFNLTERKTEY